MHPATLLQREEVFLLLALTLFSCASFQSIYKEKFGLPGDVIFCCLTMSWLSRFLVVRWLCTWDTTTSASPTIRGVLSHFMTSHILAGQYFDRPSPQALARQGTGATRVEEDGRAALLSTFIMPSIFAGWNLLRVRILFPALKWNEAWNDQTRVSKSPVRTISESSHHSPNQSAKRRGSDRDANAIVGASNHLTLSPSVQKILTATYKVYQATYPALQISIPACTLIYYTWRLPFARYLLPFTARHKYATDLSRDANGVANQYLDQPEWSEVLFVASFLTVASLLCFSRLINPIPDLVAGCNVLKAVRNEARTQGGIGSKSSKSKVQKENQDGPWAEQNKSIVSQNRLRLVSTVGTLRILENLFVAVILPWTGYACRATCHCQEGIQLWQLSTILFPVGITSAERADAVLGKDFEDIQADYLSAVVIAFSVIMVSLMLLVAQAVTLNGSYLAIMGYICGEWSQVDPQKDASIKSGGANPSQWDPKRRYKKGDFIVMNRSFWFPRQAYYKATSTSPEGLPFDLFLQVTHDLFRNELGHPSASKLLTLSIQVHLIFIVLLMVIVIGNGLSSGSSANGLLYALAGNIVGCYGTIHAGFTNRSELQQLAKRL